MTIIIALYSMCMDFSTYVPHSVFSIPSFISDQVTGITSLLCESKLSGFLQVPLFSLCTGNMILLGVFEADS